MKYVILILTIVLTSLAFAQSENTPKQTFQLAKEFMNEGRYGLAKDQFKTLTEVTDENPYAEYASFFYAVCSYKEGYSALARDMFHQITRRFPEWDKIDEVKHWLSVIYFESEDYYRGFEFGAAIKNEELVDLNLDTQKHFLTKINSLDSLTDLYNVFPKNKGIAEKLLFTQFTIPYSNRDYLLIEEISSAFPDLEKVLAEQMPSSELKETYQVSLLLPFATEMLDMNHRQKPNEFVFDLYRGIQMAIDSLNTEEEKILLNAYDTKRDTTLIRSILDQPKLSNSDLIIGPLYHTELISDYSLKNQINILHPLSKNYSLTTDNPFFYLFTTRPMDVVLNAARYLKKQENFKKGIVFYRETALDEMLVQLFLDSIGTNDSLEIEAIGIGQDDSKKILNTLTTGNVVNRLSERENRIKGDSIDFIYVLAMEKAVTLYSDVLTAVEARGDSIEVFGSTNWLNDKVVDLSVFEKHHVTMTDTDFINQTSSLYKEFTDRYLSHYGILPSKYSVIGYESMMYFGKLLIDNGNRFQYSLAEEESKAPGILMSDKNYYRSNTNIHAPLFQWDGTQLKQVDHLK